MRLLPLLILFSSFVCIKCLFDFVDRAGTHDRLTDLRISFVMDLATTYDISIQDLRGIYADLAAAGDITLCFTCLAVKGFNLTTFPLH